MPIQSLMLSATNETSLWDHLPSKGVLTQRALLPRKPEQWTSRVSWQMSWMNGHLKTMFCEKTLSMLRALCPGKPEKWICRVSSPVSLMISHFKTIFKIQLYYLKKLSLLGGLINEHAEPSQSHQQVANSRPSSQYNSINLKKPFSLET